MVRAMVGSLVRNGPYLKIKLKLYNNVIEMG